MVPKPVRHHGPSCWDCSSGRSRNLHIDGLRVKYTGPGEEVRDAASIRTNVPVAADTCIYYWEVEIVNQGRKGFIGIGFTSHGDKSNRLPGWDAGSWGYHGDDGHAFQGGTGVHYGPKFGTGDVIGVILNQADETISYTKNGVDLGVAFENVKAECFFPTVGLRTPQEEVLANFGATPFKHSIDSIRSAACKEARERIHQIALPVEEQGSFGLAQLVFEHLKHNGYWRSADALARDVGASWGPVTPSDVQDQQARKDVSDAVRAGNIQDAIQMAEALAPGVFDAHPHILLQLELQAFIELVRGRDTEGATRKAQYLGTLAPVPSNEKLMEVISLLAFANPETCPSSHCLDIKLREEGAAALNGAILQQQGKRERSCLETAYRQLRVWSRSWQPKETSPLYWWTFLPC
eukprot:jgi/Botrbrau1/19297/Bobra.0073s0040.1